MNELVFAEYGQAFTDSITIAEMFSKRHDNVKRDIESVWEKLNDRDFVSEALELGIDLDALKFEGIGYKDSQNRNQQKYILNFDAFLIVTMGYTTQKAMLIKVKYMNAFNKMKQELEKPKTLTEHEQRIELLKLSLEHEQKFSEVDQRIGKLEENIRIDAFQQTVLQKQIGIRVYKVFEEHNPDSLELKKLFPKIHRNLRDAFGVPTYKDIRKIDFDEAVSWVKSWRPLI